MVSCFSRNTPLYFKPDESNTCSRAANSLRALKPMELQDPMVAFSIFASVTITRAGTFTTLSEGLEFISKLLKAL